MNDRAPYAMSTRYEEHGIHWWGVGWGRWFWVVLWLQSTRYERDPHMRWLLRLPGWWVGLSLPYATP